MTHARHLGFQRSVHPRDYYLNMKSLWQKVLAIAIQPFVCCLCSETCKEKLNHHTTCTQNLQRVERSLRHQILVTWGWFEPSAITFHFKLRLMFVTWWQVSFGFCKAHSQSVIVFIHRNCFRNMLNYIKARTYYFFNGMNKHNAPKVCTLDMNRTRDKIAQA